MSKVDDTLKVLVETGESDQDYDHDFYNAVCKKLKKAGFPCRHREFDKYQGVYINIQGFGDIWTKDVYYTNVHDKDNRVEHVALWPEGESEDEEIMVTRTGEGKNTKVDIKSLLSFLRTKVKAAKKDKPEESKMEKSKAGQVLELFGFGEPAKPTLSAINNLARRFNMSALDFVTGPHRIFVQVDWLDKSQNGLADKFLDALLDKGYASNAYAVNKKGEYVQKAKIGSEKTRKFQTGLFRKPFSMLNQGSPE